MSLNLERIAINAGGAFGSLVVAGFSCDDLVFFRLGTSGVKAHYGGVLANLVLAVDVDGDRTVVRSLRNPEVNELHRFTSRNVRSIVSVLGAFVQLFGDVAGGVFKHGGLAGAEDLVAGFEARPARP